MDKYTHIAGYSDQEVAELVRRLEILVQQQSELDRRKAYAKEQAGRRRVR